MFSRLPQDIQAEVLVRLPAKSLWKLRCVSKSWKSLIDSKEFIDLHLRGAGSSGRPNKFIFGICHSFLRRRKVSRRRYRVKTYAAEFASKDKMEATMVELRCPFRTNLDHNTHFWGYYINGSCNGLICLTSDRSNVVLWNPSINKHWRLPYSRVSPPPLVDNCYLTFDRFRYGFGYDDIADDYKVVRLVQFENKKDRRTPVHHEVNVYSLKSNSWRSIPWFPPPFAFDGHAGAGKLANCALHWIMRVDYEFCQRQIVVLDLRSEECQIVPLPRDICMERHWELGVLDGRLSVLCRTLSSPQGDLWIMRDYGVKDSWTRLILTLNNIEDQFFFRDFIASSQNSPKLFVQSGDKILWHDTENQVVEKARVDGLLSGNYCIDSLVKPYSDAATHYENKSNKRKRRRTTSVTNLTPRRSARLLDSKRVRI